MTNIQIHPVYAIIDYAWDLIKANTEYGEDDYGGRIAVIPTSQQPEFTAINKPFVVYSWSESASGDIHEMRGGIISFAVYGTTDRQIVKIANLLATAFSKYDESAEDINTWKIGKVYDDIRFTTLWSGMFDGPIPAEAEGGRQASVVSVRFRYITKYDYIRP